MSEHLRATVADIDARLDALQYEMQRLTDAKGVLLKLMGVSAVESPSAPVDRLRAVIAAGTVATIDRSTPLAKTRRAHTPTRRASPQPGGRDAQILKTLDAMRVPVPFGTIVRDTGLPVSQVKRTLAQLVTLRKVLVAGKRAGTRYSLPPSNGSGRAAAQPPAADTEGDARRGGAHARG